MKKKYLLIPLVVILSAFILVQCSPKSTPTAAAADGLTLLNSRCTVCHKLGPVTSQQHTKDEWTQIVNQMAQRGAILSSSEETILIDYLTANYGR